MNILLEQLNLKDFLDLLSFDTKMLKVMSKSQKEQLVKDYKLVHTIFTSREGNQFTKMFRNAVIGKCSSLNGVILKSLKD